MKTAFKPWLARLLVLALASSAAFAQERAPFRQEELDQMLAPIALYPDPLLSQILMASTYPLEVVQASRWSRANPGPRGQDAVRAVERMDWDPSVKSLTAFPQVLSMMDERIDWTERLGEAFLSQQADVMDAVQGLRRRAEAAGNLDTNDRMRVSNRDGAIYIDPPAREIVYVPYYNPVVVYGPWWWPAYPPVYWAPPAAYYVVPGYRPAFLWGNGIFISAGFFFGHADWPRHHITVVRNGVVNHTTLVTQPRTRVDWQHDPAHRRGVAFRNETARERFEHAKSVEDSRRGSSAASPDHRRAAPDRTAEIRQRRMDERHEGGWNRRDEDHDRGRSGDASRSAPGNAPVSRNAHPGAESPVRPETRERQPEAGTPRVTTPAPQAAGRQPGHGERMRSQSPAAEWRPNIAAPTPRPSAAPVEPRSGVFRPETRPGNEGGRMSQHEQTRPREAAPVMRPQVNAGRPALRAENAPQRGGGPGNPGNPREPSGNRGGDRRS
jgi:hypothetical protein